MEVTECQTPIPFYCRKVIWHLFINIKFTKKRTNRSKYNNMNRSYRGRCNQLQSLITSKKNDKKRNPRRRNKQKDIVTYRKASITRKREFVRDEKHELVPHERKGVLPAASPGIRFSQELRSVRGDRNPFPTRIARARGATDEANEGGGNGDDEKK